MKTIKKSSRFKKDLKRYENTPEKIEKLEDVILMLANDIQLPKAYKAHKLTGQYRGFLECHIEDDFLLIWLDEDKQTIYLVRLGTHSELFNKRFK